MNRRRLLLRSVFATLALPSLPSFLLRSVHGDSALRSVNGADEDAKRLFAVGNLLGFQVKQLFPQAAGAKYGETTRLTPSFIASESALPRNAWKPSSSVATSSKRESPGLVSFNDSKICLFVLITFRFAETTRSIARSIETYAPATEVI